jgi:RHS repeat-associated protein
MLVSQTRNPGALPATSFYGYDAHRSIAFLTDASGTVTDTYTYDAWGNMVGSTGSTPNTRLYAGQELDPDLGLINLRARQYRPDTGRLLTLDPLMVRELTKPGSLNRYLYSDGDPINLWDPNGKQEDEEEGEEAANDARLVETISSKQIPPDVSFAPNFSRSRDKALLLQLLATQCKNLPVTATLADKLLCWMIVGVVGLL